MLIAGPSSEIEIESFTALRFAVSPGKCRSSRANEETTIELA